MEQSLAPLMAPSRRLGALALSQKSSFSRAFLKVSEGTRTPDRLDHNQNDGVRSSPAQFYLQGFLVLSFCEFRSVQSPR